MPSGTNCIRNQIHMEYVFGKPNEWFKSIASRYKVGTTLEFIQWLLLVSLTANFACLLALRMNLCMYEKCHHHRHHHPKLVYLIMQILFGSIVDFSHSFTYPSNPGSIFIRQKSNTAKVENIYERAPLKKLKAWQCGCDGWTTSKEHSSKQMVQGLYQIF